MWRLVDTVAHCLPKALKSVISRKLWDTDGSIGGGEVVLTLNDMPYLEGLRDAQVDGAQQLIDAIEKHGVVVVWHEH
jgi:hypothetical protein